MTQLGFLGLGSMGSAIAGRLVETGHAVRVWNRSPDAFAPLVAAGASVAATAADALAAPISFSMLANDEAAEAVLTRDALEGADGRIHVNMASISADAADRLTERFADAGIAYVAAPVLGRPVVAAAGKLNILAAGPGGSIDAVAGYLDDLGVRTWRLGDRPRVANVVKIAVNYNLLQAIEVIGESVAVVERHGVEPVLFVELLAGSLFGGVAHTGYGNLIANQTYNPPGFRMELGLKDLGLAEDVANEVGIHLPSAPALRAVFERALADDVLAQQDWSAIAEVTRQDML